MGPTKTERATIMPPIQKKICMTKLGLKKVNPSNPRKIKNNIILPLVISISPLNNFKIRAITKNKGVKNRNTRYAQCKIINNKRGKLEISVSEEKFDDERKNLEIKIENPKRNKASNKEYKEILKLESDGIALLSETKTSALEDCISSSI